MEGQDKYTTANQLFQKGLGTGLELATERQKTLLAEATAKRKKVEEERDLWLKNAGNKDFPKNIRMQFFNQAASADKELNPQGHFPGIDSFDDQVGDILDSFGVIDNDKGLDAAKKLSMKRQLITAQNRQQGDLKQTEFLQSMAFGAGSVQTTGQGISQTQTRLTPEGVAVPIQTNPIAASPAGASAPAPLKVTNKDLQDRLVGLREKFYGQENVKDNQFILGKLGQIQKLAKENPAGAAGALKQGFVRLFEKQRISDEDFVNLNPSQSGQAKLMDWVAKTRAGKASELTGENIRLVARVIGDKVREDVNSTIGSQVGADMLLLEGSGIDEDYLGRFYKGSMAKDLAELDKYNSVGAVDAAVKSKELGKQEGAYIKKDRNLKPASVDKPIKDMKSADVDTLKARLEKVRQQRMQLKNKKSSKPTQTGSARG